LILHSLFEALAWILAIAIGWWARRRYFPAAGFPMARASYPLYLLLLWLGAAAGAYGLGSLNLALAGGDGIHRHPVQLYESLAMACFALAFFLWLRREPQSAARYGFYIFAGFYAAQRFLWEFLKPYPKLIGPFNLFHLAAALLLIYAFVVLRRPRRIHAIA